MYKLQSLVFFKLFPARGWKLLLARHCAHSAQTFSNFSPQGDGNGKVACPLPNFVKSFFKLFPARGWKRFIPLFRAVPLELFQTFPRKGMETKNPPYRRSYNLSFSNFSPQGDGNLANASSSFCVSSRGLFQTFPRKGMETG